MIHERKRIDADFYLSLILEFYLNSLIQIESFT